MNFNAITPKPITITFQPHRVSSTGNLYRIPVIHKSSDGSQDHNFEIWTTKEAVQQHFRTTTGEEPRAYELKKFARQMYEKQLRSSGGRIPEHKGILVTTDHVMHGDPHTWPHALNHPEIKL